MDGNLPVFGAQQQVEAFEEKFLQAVSERKVHVEFSLSEVQENVTIKNQLDGASQEEADAALQHFTDSYMRDIDEIGEKIDQAIEKDTLQTDEEIGLDRYTYYYIRQAEIEGLPEKDIHDIRCQKLRDFNYTKEQREASGPFSDSHDDRDGDPELGS